MHHENKNQCGAKSDDLPEESKPPFEYGRDHRLCELPRGHDGFLHREDDVEWEYGNPLHVTILEEAQRLIYGDRAADYGPPTESFENIARLWSAYLYGRAVQDGTLEDGSGLPEEITAYDVAYLMILLKISRNTTGGYKRDSVVDIAGYAACIARMHDGK